MSPPWGLWNSCFVVLVLMPPPEFWTVRFGFVVWQHVPYILSPPNISPVHHTFYKMLHRWSISALTSMFGHMECSVCILLDDRRWRINIDAYPLALCINLASIIDDLYVQIVHLFSRPIPRKLDGFMRCIDVIKKIPRKDNKPAFNDHPTCRLINPSKSEIGVVSKHILDEINSAIIRSTQINQWKNTSSVLSWFNKLENKETLSFICFDVCDFYPSITEKLLSKALHFADKYRPISSHERDIILHAKRSLLFSNDSPWEKKIFKWSLRHYHGFFRRCRNVWIGRLLPAIPPYRKVWPKHRSLPRRWTSGLQQNTAANWKDQKGNVQNFRDHGLKITIEANKTIVNFLDVTLDLQSGKHYPFTKEGNIPLYVHKKSNHPPSILKVPKEHPDILRPWMFWQRQTRLPRSTQ